jgi:hypothetical protein
MLVGYARLAVLESALHAQKEPQGLTTTPKFTIKFSSFKPFS